MTSAHEDGGASIVEQLVGCARSNNEQLLEQLLTQHAEGAKPRAQLINQTRDPVGAGLLHLAAGTGSFEVVDYLLDQEGVEVDPRDRMEENTPLHCAVRCAATTSREAGTAVAELLVEAGAAPALRNKQGHRPIDLAQNAGLTQLVQVLRGAQLAYEMVAEADPGDPGDPEDDEASD